MSTMREEPWPEPDVIVTGQGYHEHAYSVRLVRQIADAAYAAGQRAATEQAAKVAEDWYFGDPGEVNHSIANAIRTRDKEQG